MEFNEIITAISTTGFPIIVAMYSLIRLEKTVSTNTEIMQKLTMMMEGKCFKDV